ncbi:MAG TPA: MotA/TolQ/ExbB proton channel family protein [Pirellulaceae bacterium]|nr:MotA/TolQ/ExbB proton channel family protein [Pirellulaceae bacterium]
MTVRNERSSLFKALSGLGWPLVIGAAACSVFYVLIFQGPLNTEAMNRYFASHPVSLFATGMFFVGLAALLIKFADVCRQYLVFSRVNVDLSAEGESSIDACPRLLDNLDELPKYIRQTYLAQRFCNAVDFVDRKQSGEGLDEELKYLSDVDAARQQESFSLVRIIIWATPMLGFLGTVIGITKALGELGAQSELLATDPNAAMQSLLSGLYVAFDTTALALCLSIVLMFIQFLVDRIETQLLINVDDRVHDELVGCFDIGNGSEPQSASLQAMANAVVTTTEKIVRSQSEHWHSTIDHANDKWNQMLKLSGETISNSLTQSLDASVQNLSQSLAKAHADTDEKMGLRWEQWQTALSANARLLYSQQQELVRQSEIMSKVLDATDTVTSLEQTLNDNLQALAGAKNFEDTVMSLAATIHLLNSRLAAPTDLVRRVELQSSNVRPSDAGQTLEQHVEQANPKQANLKQAKPKQAKPKQANPEQDRAA